MAPPELSCPLAELKHRAIDSMLLVEMGDKVREMLAAALDRPDGVNTVAGDPPSRPAGR